MRAALLVASALLGAALAVQVVYARAYAANASVATKAVWAANIALLGAVAAGLAWYAFARAG